MKAEELIIGHFDSSLTQAQEAELQRMLAGSSETRATYERHASIHSMLLQDAASVAPSRALDAAVIGAALGTPAEIAGGSAIGAGVGAKVAAIISTFAVGGLTLVLMTTSTSEQRFPAHPAAQIPAVRTAPNNTPSATPQPQKAESTAAATERVEGEQTEVGLASTRPAAPEAARAGKKETHGTLHKGSTSAQPTLTLPSTETVITHPAKVGNGGDGK